LKTFSLKLSFIILLPIGMFMLLMFLYSKLMVAFVLLKNDLLRDSLHGTRLIFLSIFIIIRIIYFFYQYREADLPKVAHSFSGTFFIPVLAVWFLTSFAGSFEYISIKRPFAVNYFLHASILLFVNGLIYKYIIIRYKKSRPLPPFPNHPEGEQKQD